MVIKKTTQKKRRNNVYRDYRAIGVIKQEDSPVKLKIVRKLSKYIYYTINGFKKNIRRKQY